MCQKYKVCVILTVNVFIVLSSIFCLEHVTMLHVTLDMMQPIVMKLSFVKTCSLLYSAVMWIYLRKSLVRLEWMKLWNERRNYWIFHSISKFKPVWNLHLWKHFSKNIQNSTERNGLQFLLGFHSVCKYLSKMCVLNFVTSLWQQLEYLVPISSNVIRTCVSRAECISSVPNEVITADKHTITIRKLRIVQIKAKFWKWHNKLNEKYEVLNVSNTIIYLRIAVTSVIDLFKKGLLKNSI